jgi:hypothetical protein
MIQTPLLNQQTTQQLKELLKNTQAITGFVIGLLIVYAAVIAYLFVSANYNILTLCLLALFFR